MSLYLPEQKLGSHSQETGSSPKFILKGRQTGGVHRGHSWVFRAESYDTMMAWYEDIKALTEKTPQERNEFVRGHSRSFSRTSSRRSISSDGMVDEDDDEPYAAHTSPAALSIGQGPQQDVPRRPSPGGRFPSDIEVHAQRGLQAPLSPSSIIVRGPSPSVSQQEPYPGNTGLDAARALPGSAFEQYYNSAAANEELPQGSYVQAPNPVNARMLPVQSQPSAAPYANHPATIIAARAAQNNAGGAQYPVLERANGHEATWSSEALAEAASYSTMDGRGISQPAQGPYVTGGQGLRLSNADVHIDGAANGQPTANVVDHAPRTTVVSGPFANRTAAMQESPAVNERPAPSERSESEATLSSEVQTISNLHVPGQYPKTSAM